MKFFITALILYICTLSSYGELNITCLQDPELVNGCSVPFGVEFPYKEFFKPACDRHDICYACGTVYEWKRKSCDDGFKKNMIYLCHYKESSRKVRPDHLLNLFYINWKEIIKELKGSWLITSDMIKWLELKTGSLEHCLNGVDMYFNVVRSFAKNYFEKKSEKDCSSKCTNVLGNPNIGIQHEGITD